MPFLYLSSVLLLFYLLYFGVASVRYIDFFDVYVVVVVVNIRTNVWTNIKPLEQIEPDDF